MLTAIETVYRGYRFRSRLFECPHCGQVAFRKNGRQRLDDVVRMHRLRVRRVVGQFEIRRH
jgi:hypothetical protein